MTPNDQKKMRGIPTKQRAWRMWFKKWIVFILECLLIAACAVTGIYLVIYWVGDMYLKP